MAQATKVPLRQATHQVLCVVLCCHCNFSEKSFTVRGPPTPSLFDTVCGDYMTARATITMVIACSAGNLLQP